MKEIKAVIKPFRLEDVVQVIQKAAHTGRAGDGRIFVIPVEQTVKIRTGERDTWT